MNTIRRGRRGTTPGPISAKSRWGPMRHLISAAAVIAISVLTNAMPAKAIHPAHDGVEIVHEVTWIHMTPDEVSSFVLYVSPTPGSLAVARQINVGKPGGSGSARFFSALVPMGADEFVAVGAIGQNGLRSILSEWNQAQPSRPGQPLVVEP